MKNFVIDPSISRTAKVKGMMDLMSSAKAADSPLHGVAVLLSLLLPSLHC